MSKANLPNSVTGGLNYISEKQKYMELYESSTRTQVGQTSFTATISGITYNTIDYPDDVTIYNKGEEGLLQILKNILQNYNIDANDFNGKIDSTMLDTDGTLDANSDAKIPTQKAVKTYALAKTDKTTQAQAEAGVDDEKFMTALKTKQSIDKNAVKNNFSSITYPTKNNDISEGYIVGSIWINTTTYDIYICTNNSDGHANWVNIAKNELVLYNLGEEYVDISGGYDKTVYTTNTSLTKYSTYFKVYADHTTDDINENIIVASIDPIVVKGYNRLIISCHRDIYDVGSYGTSFLTLGLGLSKTDFNFTHMNELKFSNTSTSGQLVDTGTVDITIDISSYLDNDTPLYFKAMAGASDNDGQNEAYAFVEIYEIKLVK